MDYSIAGALKRLTLLALCLAHASCGANERPLGAAADEPEDFALLQGTWLGTSLKGGLGSTNDVINFELVVEDSVITIVGDLYSGCYRIRAFDDGSAEISMGCIVEVYDPPDPILLGRYIYSAAGDGFTLTHVPNERWQGQTVELRRGSIDSRLAGDD